jgi:hypothetical protein
MLIKCPPHGYVKWRLVQFFYEGLTQSNRSMIESMNGGAFLKFDRGMKHIGLLINCLTVRSSGIFRVVKINLPESLRKEAYMRLRRIVI